MPNPKTSNPHLRPEALAERWGVAPKTLANMRTAGTGPTYVKIGGSVRYPLDAVEAYEADNTVQAVA